MYRPHKPLYSRASLSPPYSQIGFAIDPPRPVLNLESKRLRGPDVPAPKPVRDPLRELVAFWAQFNTVTQRISAVMAPVVALSRWLESVKKQLVLRPLTCHK